MSDASVMTWSTAGEAEEPRVSQEPQVVHPWSRLTHHQHLFFDAATWAALWFPRTFICPHRLHLVVENFPPADEAAVSLLCFHLHPGRSPWVGGLTRCRWTCDWWHGVVPALTRQNVLIWRMSKKKKSTFHDTRSPYLPPPHIFDQKPLLEADKLNTRGCKKNYNLNITTSTCRLNVPRWVIFIGCDLCLFGSLSPLVEKY